MGIGFATALKSAVLLTLVAPLIVMSSPLPDTYFPYIVGKALYVRTLAQIALVLWVILVFWYPRYRVPRSWIMSILGAYVFIALLASLLGVSPQRSMWSTYERMQGWIDLAHWFALTVVVVSVYRSFGDWRNLLQFNLAINLVVSVLGLAEINGVQLLSFLSTRDRLEITLGNSTFVGAYMVVNVFIALAFIGYSLVGTKKESPQVSRRVQRRRKRAQSRSNTFGGLGHVMDKVFWWRIFWITVILLDIMMIVRSGTRGAVVGLVVGLLVFALTYILWGKLRRVKALSIVLNGGIILVVIGFVAVKDVAWFRDVTRSNLMVTRLANIGSGDFSTMGRINSIRIGFSGFMERPLFGWGPENYTLSYDRHLTAEVAARSTESFDQAHNKIIEELVTKGIFGLGAYLAIWIVTFWIMVRRIKYQVPDVQLFTILIGSAASAYFAQNMFLFDTPGTVGQFYILLGFAVFVETTPHRGYNSLDNRLVGEEAIPKWVDHYRFLRSDLTKKIAIAVGGTAVIFSVYFFVYGPYQGARNVLVALNLEANQTQARTWTDRIGYFDKSIDASPQLANYPRRYMFHTLSEHWNSLSNEEIQLALERADREGIRALKVEPMEWRIHFALANFYQTASIYDTSYLDKSADLLDEALRLAPERTELKQLQVRQFVKEGDVDAAMKFIDDYLETNSEYLVPDSGVAQTFESMKTGVELIIEALGDKSTTTVVD